ncbi:MAG: toprim domain-containing protein [Bacteroidetes bacterium]|nr:toprim domain-containing protein [Bacteroidota bacterium]
MEITEIKQQLTILEALSHYQLQPNRNNMLCCPFHNDKTPSLQIYPQTNTFCCFSSNCTAGTGDVIEFIRLMEKSSKHEAILKAQSLINPTTTMTETVGRIAVMTKYYQSCLQGMSRSPQAKEYAQQRHLNIDLLGIGFNGADFYKRWNNVLAESGVQVGLLRKTASGYTPKFKNCLIFPMKNSEGQVIDVYGRSTIDNGEQRHFYLPGRHQGLYPCYPKAETKKLIVTESIIDAATLEQTEIRKEYSVLASYGTNGFTPEHEQAIKELKHLDEIIIFFDGDEAGREGSKKLSQQLQALATCAITNVSCPEGEDVNSLAQSHEPEIFTHLLSTRKPFSFSIEKENTPVSKLNSHLHTENPELLFYQNGVLNITVLGGIRIAGMDRMRVTLKLESKTKENSLPLRHNLDLYNKGQVDQLTNQAAEIFDVSTLEATHALAGLTTALEQYRQSKLESLKPKKEERRQLSDQEKQQALKYLKASDLMKQTLQDIARTGIVGEKVNSMIAYLTYTSRKREKPLHLMCLGASGTGKTYLQERVSQLMPEEDKLEITTLSENAFYYFDREELKHKLILIEDLDGAGDVLYPLRELQSKTSISKTVTLKDNKGNLKTITLKVEGPVSVSSCTTREKIYEDNANRCILIYIDTTPEQDKRIMEYQQQYSAGMVNQAAENETKELLKNVQRLLRPIKIRNPYAQQINLPESVFKPRRTMLLLLSFIETITFYHQYQREVKQDKESGEIYIESTAQDVEYAFKLMKEILFSKSDELTGACRKFFEQAKAWLKKENKQSFHAAEIRKMLRINPNNLKRYMIELSRYGFVKITGGSKYKGYEYQVIDPKEYEQLKGDIDKKLDQILQSIKAKQ